MNQNLNKQWYSIAPTVNRIARANMIPTTLEELNTSRKAISVTDEFIDNARIYTSITNITTEDGHLIITFGNGLVFDCGVVKGDKIILRKTIRGIEYRYEGSSIDSFQILVPIADILFKFENLTATQKEELSFHYSDFTASEIAILKKPATDAATEAGKVIVEAKDQILLLKGTDSAIKSADQVRSQKETEREVSETARKSNEEIRISSEKLRVQTEEQVKVNEQSRIANNTSINNTESVRAGKEVIRENNESSRVINENIRIVNEDNRKKSDSERSTIFSQAISNVNVATSNAQEIADHPNYVGTDFYIYQWNKTTKSYNKLDICLRPEAFNIYRVFKSILDMKDHKIDVPVGKFVLINTDNVEEADTAKLYVRTTLDYDFLVDMSGMRGFSGKTAQFIIGNVLTTEYGAIATVTLSEAGNDIAGNPIYAINISVPQGKPGSSFMIFRTFNTYDTLKTAIPDGKDINGCCAVGLADPYNYYFWSKNNQGVTDWHNHGQLKGQKGDPYIWNDLTIAQKLEMATSTGNYMIEHMKIDDLGHLVFDSQK